MFLIDNPQALPAPPAIPAAGDPGWFSIGNPSLNQPATPVDDWWLNMVQGELKAILDAAGIEMAKGNNAQVVAAINQLIADAISGISLVGYAKLAVAQVWTKQQSCQVAVLADAATIAWDVSAAQMAEVTIAATRALALPTNMVAGTRYELTVIHGAANTTLSFAPGYTGVSGLALSTGNGAIDVLTFRSNGASMRLVALALNVGA